MTIRQLTEALVSLVPFIPRDRPWGSFQDAAVALGLGDNYARAISNAYVPIVLPVAAQRGWCAPAPFGDDRGDSGAGDRRGLDLGLPGREVWPQEMRWDAEAVGAAYARCESRLLHAAGPLRLRRLKP